MASLLWYVVQLVEGIKETSRKMHGEVGDLDPAFGTARVTEVAFITMWDSASCL